MAACGRDLHLHVFLHHREPNVTTNGHSTLVAWTPVECVDNETLLLKTALLVMLYRGAELQFEDGVRI